MKHIHKKIQLADDEQIELLLRKFWLSMVYRLSLGLVLFAAPWFFMVPLFNKGSWGIAVFVAIMLLGLFLIFKSVWVWYNDVFVITNNRVIDINRRGLFDTVVSEAQLDKIEDVSYRQKGVWQTMMKYGTVFVQTDGEALILEVNQIKSPDSIHNKINDLVKSQYQSGKKLKFKKIYGGVDFSQWDQSEIIGLLDKLLAEVGEEEFVRAISEFIDLEEE